MYLWLSCSTTYENFFEIRHQEAEKARGLSYSVTVLSKQSFPSRSLVPNSKSFWINNWHQEQKAMQHQSNLVPRRFPGNLVRNPRVFKGDASVDYDFTVIGKFCFFLAWYRTENGSTSFEERFFGKISRGEWVKIPGGSKKENKKKTKQKKTASCWAWKTGTGIG